MSDHRQYRELLEAGGLFPPYLHDEILEASGSVVTGHAGAAGFDGVGDVGDGLQLELLDLAQQVRFGETKALADESSLLLFLVSNVDSENRKIDGPFLGPVEHGRFERLGTHHRAVNLLLRQPFQVIDDVLIRDLQGLDWGEVSFLDDRAQSLRSGDRRGATECEVSRLGDDVLGRIRLVTVCAKRETQGVTTREGAVFAETVRIVDLPEMAAGAPVDGVHEEFGGLFRVVPGHHSPPGRAKHPTGGEHDNRS